MANTLAEVFPDSKFIHLYRHPYAVIRSGMRRGFYQNHPWDFCRVRPLDHDSIYADWQYFTPLQKVAWYWASINEQSLCFLDTLPEHRKFALSSESLFSGDTAMITSLFDFVAAEQPEQKAIREVLGLKCNAQRSGDFPQADEWSSLQIQQVHTMVEKTAGRLGYSLLE